MSAKKFASALQGVALMPGFYSKLFARLVCEKPSFFSLPWHLKEEEERAKSIAFFSLQDPFKFKARARSKNLADLLLDPKGDIHLHTLSTLIEHLEKEGYIPHADAFCDHEMIDHFLYVLKRFLSEPKFKGLLRKFQMPLCHKYAETLVRSSVGKLPGEPLTDRDVRLAALSACLYPLRQNVGSCFATAPAILIQKEQIENILYDLYELLTTSRMTRIIEGAEHSVPMCPSIGLAELKKPLSTLSCQLITSSVPYSISAPLKSTGIDVADLSPSWLLSCVEKIEGEGGLVTLEKIFQETVFETCKVTKEEMEQFILREDQIAKAAGRSQIVAIPPASSKQKILHKAREDLTAVIWHFLMMTEDPLARMWEYTIASLSEVKMDFSRWNLFTSLGLKHTDTGGIGPVIYEYVEKKIKESNARLEQYQNDYETAFDQLRAVEALLKRASSESEARRLKAEFQSRSYHMQMCLEVRDQFYKKASFYPQLFNYLIESFDKRFPDSFQEIYDPLMQEVDAKEYEDAPAGFRLVYKHGRRDASLWSMINTKEQFIDALVDFFTFIQHSILLESEEKGISDDVQYIFSLIITHIKGAEFIESALKRSKKESSKDHKTPWSYISGGVMDTLIKTYFVQPKEVDHEPFTIESALDLLTVSLETMKGIPYNFSVYFPKESNKRMLMHSPTHAFLLEPYREPFYRGWDDSGFTYTWIRDHFIERFLRFYRSITLAISEQQFLLQLLSQRIPEQIFGRLSREVCYEDLSSPKEFMENVMNVLGQHPLLEDVLASFLYGSLPLFAPEEALSSITHLLTALEKEKAAALVKELPAFEAEYVPSYLLKEIATGLIVLAEKKLGLSFDVHELVSKKADEMNLSAPLPLIFADTNWSQNLFGFVVSPLHETVELWRVKGLSTQGMKMRDWSFHLKKDGGPWGIYTRPQQYSTLFEKKM